MHEMAYAAMVESGVAINFDHEVWVDKAGNITNKENAFGRKTRYLLTHPKMVFDEVGDNT